VTLRGHEKDAQSIKFARDGKENTFITCSSDKTVKLWDMREGKVAKSFATDSELNACAFFPNGNLIAAGGEKDKTYVFDVRAYRELQKYARNNMKTASCEFSSSGRELYVGHDDGAIIVWDMFASGENKNYAKKSRHTARARAILPNLACRSSTWARKDIWRPVGSMALSKSGGRQRKVQPNHAQELAVRRIAVHARCRRMR